MKTLEEVYNAVKAGERVYYSCSPPPINAKSYVKIDGDEYLRWESTLSLVAISDRTCNPKNWHIEVPPEKEYEFAEAFAMMKQGKWMKPNGSMDCRTQADGQPHGKWLVRQVGCLATYQFDCFPVAFIESKWTEAKD